jgi:hypothetical protein
MATKQFYATGDFKYGTRMLRAGDPVQLDGPNARLFTALGKISRDRPRAVTSLARPDADGSGGLIQSSPMPPKAATKRKVAKRRATKKAK